MKLCTIVVDDEPLALGMLASVLDELPDVEVLAQCSNGREAASAIADMEPDLVFLDIQMPGMNGFDVVKAIQADVMPLIVFVTAYDHFAIDAFDLHAVDYVLKPYETSRIERALERARARLAQDPVSVSKQALIGAIDDIAQKARQSDESLLSQSASEGEEAVKDKLVIRDGGVATLLPMEDIDWVDAAGDYMCVHALGETHILRSTLKELLTRLDESVFRRVHRSTVVNIMRIRQITRLKKGECLLQLDHDVKLKVSRNFRSSIAELLK